MWTVDQSQVITAEQKQVDAKLSAIAAYKAAFDAHLDAVAQERQYDNRLTIAGYLGSTHPQWATEAQAFVAWRDQALLYMFGQLASFDAGEITPPTIETFLAGIPPIAWPAA